MDETVNNLYKYIYLFQAPSDDSNLTNVFEYFDLLRIKPTVSSIINQEEFYEGLRLQMNTHIENDQIYNIIHLLKTNYLIKKS